MSEIATEIARSLEELGALDPIALDVSGQSSFTEAFVIAGAESLAQLRGLQRRIHDTLTDLDLDPRQSPRRNDESGWLLLDCNSVIIHLMLADQRSFYELEKLWFDAPILYSTADTDG
ncbi:MAG TPA: ribosome silencing factor [Alkalispirochaeta sp.]|nr:ribosome silencing factor [Alkalispirochaeta sp.]